MLTPKKECKSEHAHENDHDNDDGEHHHHDHQHQYNEYQEKLQLKNPDPNETNRPQGEQAQKFTEAKVIEVLEEGDIFGEISIFSNLRRTATVRSSECCQFQTLNKEAFQTI